jgi:LysM repeat protein
LVQGSLRSLVQGSLPVVQGSLRQLVQGSLRQLVQGPHNPTAVAVALHRFAFGNEHEAKEGVMGLREKYSHAIDTAKQFRMQGSADERDGKLHFHGTVDTQDQANKIWDAIKTVPEWPKEIVADIKATHTGGTAAPNVGSGSSGHRSYTVKAGDTLSKIAKEMLGSSGAYMDIFNANRDQLTDPDMIKPGQVLKIPEAAHK